VQHFREAGHAEAALEARHRGERDADALELRVVDRPRIRTPPAETDVASAAMHHGAAARSAREVVVDEPGAAPRPERIAEPRVEAGTVARRLLPLMVEIDRRRAAPQRDAARLGGAAQHPGRRLQRHGPRRVPESALLHLVFVGPLPQRLPRLAEYIGW